MAGDLNREASELWNSLQPIIDKEIDARTQGVVQRRKAKVTTAPSLVTNTIGVTEPFGTEMFLPFNTNIMSASVGDFVWVEYMYGMTNAFVSMFASADDKNQYVAGNLTVGGVLDVVPRRCEATLSAAGWYRAIVYNAYDTLSAQGTSGEIVTIKIVYTSSVSVQHEISLWMSYGKVAFLNETSHGTTNLVDKIRYTYAGSVGYVDIHITSSSSVQYNVSFDVASRIYAQGRWVAGTLTSVAASPSGETVLTEYALNAYGVYNDNVTVGGVLDVTQRRSWNVLSQAGWYRVLTFSGANANSAIGNEGFIIHFDISTTFNNNNNAAHSISLHCVNGAVRFVNEQSSCYSTPPVDKIRYNRNGSYGYVDIHYTQSYGNVVSVRFDVSCRQESQYRFAANTLLPVAPSPSGETVLAEYEFVADRSGEAFYAGSFSGADDTVIQQACEAIRAHFPNDIGKYSNNPFPVSFFRTQAWEFVGTGWIRASRVYLIVETSYNGKLYIVSQESSGATPTIKTFATTTEYARNTWTPTFSGTANPSVSNASCFYSVKNGVLYAGGRFNLASFTSGATTADFTLPVSLGSADRTAEAIGTMFTTTKTLHLRWTGSTVYITDAGGNYSGGLLNTGYWSFQIVAPIYN